MDGFCYGDMVQIVAPRWSKWKFMLMHRIDPARRPAGASIDCTWVAWPLIYGIGNENGEVYLPSDRIELVKIIEESP